MTLDDSNYCEHEIKRDEQGFPWCGKCLKNVGQQLEFVKKALKINKAVAENQVRDLTTELGAQRKYINHLEGRCKKEGVIIFVDEARDQVPSGEGQTVS